MALTSSQFYFLLKEKVIHRDTPIEVKRNFTVKGSDDFKIQKSQIIEAGLYNVYSSDDHTKFAIGYYDLNNRSEIKHCPISCITTIEGQDVDRYYKALEELMGNKNAHTITEPTDVINTVIGKSKPDILGIELYEGMKLILKNDKTSKYNNHILNVKGYGTSVKLVGNAGRPKTKVEVYRPKQKRGRKVGYRKCVTKLVAKQD